MHKSTWFFVSNVIYWKTECILWFQLHFLDIGCLVSYGFRIKVIILHMIISRSNSLIIYIYVCTIVSVLDSQIVEWCLWDWETEQWKDSERSDTAFTFKSHFLPSPVKVQKLIYSHLLYHNSFLCVFNLWVMIIFSNNEL